MTWLQVVAIVLLTLVGASLVQFALFYIFYWDFEIGLRRDSPEGRFHPFVHAGKPHEMEVTAPGDAHHRWVDTRTGIVREGEPIHRSENP